MQYLYSTNINQTYLKVRMKKQVFTGALITLLSIGLTACGGGSSSSGAPTASNKCSINNVAISSGTNGTLSKASSSLNTSFQLVLTEPLAIQIISNFENVAANDWIEAFPFQRSFAAGTHNVSLNYDLNSPSRTTSDIYSKLNITASLPNNEACVFNQVTNITLNP